jgi:hypothetical protein
VHSEPLYHEHDLLFQSRRRPVDTTAEQGGCEDMSHIYHVFLHPHQIFILRPMSLDLTLKLLAWETLSEQMSVLCSFLETPSLRLSKPLNHRQPSLQARTEGIPPCY